jgi:hypothetical protein
MKKNHRYSKAREAGVRTIGCSVTVLEAMRQINDNVNRYSCAGKFSPRNILDLIIYLLPLIYAMAKAMALNRGGEITVSFQETGYGDAKTVRWTNPNLPADYQSDCGQGKGKMPTSKKHVITGAKEDQPNPAHAPSVVSQPAPTAPKEEPAKTEEKPKPPKKEDQTPPLFPENQIASRKPNGGQKI